MQTASEPKSIDLTTYDSRVLEDLRAELAFWSAAADISTTFGAAGLATFGVVAARELEKTGIPMARAAGVVALVTAAIAQGGTQYIAANKSGVEKKIKDLQLSIESPTCVSEILTCREDL